MHAHGLASFLRRARKGLAALRREERLFEERYGTAAVGDAPLAEQTELFVRQTHLRLVVLRHRLHLGRPVFADSQNDARGSQLCSRPLRQHLLK